MRIALVAGPYVPVPPKQYGGIEQVIHFLIKGLQELGHEPILIAPGDSNVDCELIPNTAKALYFPRNRKEIFDHERRTKTAEVHTKKILKQLLPRIDIIHSHGFDLKSFEDFPNVTTLHNPIRMEDIHYYERRKNLPHVSISQNQQIAFPDLNYVGVAYNGEDASMFPLVSEPEDYVCFLGRFDREKNPHMAILLALSLGVKIKLAGKIDHLGEGYFEEEVAKYFDHPLVEYLGELGFDEKVELLSNAKCNIHPTGFREPFGLTVVEAAYCGTPTIAVARGAMPELIEDGRTGVLVEDIIEGFHRYQECLAMDRKYIANRARLLFNHQTMTKQYLSAYQRVIDLYASKTHQQSMLRRLLRRVPYISTPERKYGWHDPLQTP